MDDTDPEQRALVVAPDRTPVPLASLAQRTLATITAPESALVGPRQLIVSADGSAMFRTIGAALAIAIEGDEILVRPGEYRESLLIDRSVKIRGDGAKEAIVLRPLQTAASCISVEGGAPHVLGLTIDGSEFDRHDDFEADRLPILVKVGGGSPTIEDVVLIGAGGVEFAGAKAAGTLARCVLHGARWGVDVYDGASARIEDNDIWDIVSTGIDVSGSGGMVIRGNRIHGTPIGIETDSALRIDDNEIWQCEFEGIRLAGADANSVVRGNRIHDVADRGIQILNGASPLIDENDIWATGGAGIGVTNVGSGVMVIRGNRIHDGNFGIVLLNGASPQVVDNEIWGNAKAGISVSDDGTNPGIHGNLIRDGESGGVLVTDGAAPRILDNDFGRNAGSGIAIMGATTKSLVHANRIHDGRASGIFVNQGASPRIEDNDVWANRGAGIWAIGDGTDPLIRGNRIHDGLTDGILVDSGASPRIEGNDVRANHGVGIGIGGSGSKPVVTANTVQEGLSHGILVYDRAAPTIHNNVIDRNVLSAITILDGETPGGSTDFGD